MAKDVVCGMEVDPKTAAAKTEYEGKTYYTSTGHLRTPLLRPGLQGSL